MKCINKKETIVQVLTNFMGTKFDEYNDNQKLLKETLEMENLLQNHENKPELISLYNKLTHGTDRRNQLLESNRIRKKTVKWWKAVYVGIFQTIIINSWKIYE